jgi:hypothetical protein
MRAQKLRIVIATLLGLIGAAITQPSAAQTEKDHGSGGTGGAAGYSPPMPDTSRGMGAPNPDFETPSADAPEPMNAPPAAPQTTEESKPAPEDAPKDK